ncbi:MAG: class I SAM-dependent methyltransferase [Gammaproteobacteria bacterium]|nr:class I SAM-dependent methyltransferase [Gammaproteobacteria bacterium]
MHIPYSEACERNKDPILAVLQPYLNHTDSVLEIGSGTAQHAVYFAAANPHLYWQTSDQTTYIEGINAQLSVAKVDNVKKPLVLDVNQNPWLEKSTKFDLVYSANTFHIMSASDVEAFFNGLSDVLNRNGTLVVYGPFNYSGRFTSDSNASFDQRLRERGEGSSIKDFEWVNELATNEGLSLSEDVRMPANNQCLIWSKSS